MKRKIILLFFFAAFMFVGNGGCEKDDSVFMQVKEKAWNSLTTWEQSTVSISWRDAKVNEDAYNNENVYAVMFTTTEDAILGPIIVYISKSSLEIVGRGLRM